MNILSYLCVALVIGFIGFWLGLSYAGKLAYKVIKEDVEALGQFRLGDTAYKAELIKGDQHEVDCVLPD